MKLELHPNAVNNFNEKASDLLAELVHLPKEVFQSPEQSYLPDLFVSHNFNGNDIKDIIKNNVDSEGNLMAKSFMHDKCIIGLHGESCKKLIRLSESLQKTKTLNDKVSKTFLIDGIFKWLREKFVQTTSMTMTDYVLNLCEDDLKEIELWIPIAQLQIQSEFTIGKVTLKPITKDFIDKWYLQLDNLINDPAEKMRYHDFFNHTKRKKLQGYAASTIILTAEPIRANEIALEETEKAISLLRFFSGASILPQITSYWMPLGKENIESTMHLVVKNGVISIGEELIDKNFQQECLDNAYIAQMKKDGLQILSDLLNRLDRSEFQEQLLNSLYIFTKGSLEKTLSNKLVYIFVALDSFLLKNNAESIVQNISDRMAFFIGKSVKERQDIVENTKKAYDFRSSFIHHAHNIDDVETLKNFMRNAWNFFFLLIQNAYTFKTKLELFNYIEQVKYS